jgi:formylglycine-generating enzyme required for sulfatase activity
VATAEGRAARGALVAVALGALAVLGVLAATSESRPLRCAEGASAEGERCCGVGQTLARAGGAERCVGAPLSCPRGLRVAPEGCVADSHRVRLEGGRARVGPGDFEAQGVVAPRELVVASFELDSHEVTCARWARCVEAARCRALPTCEAEPGLPARGMSKHEAERFCAFEGGRLPTLDEHTFAAGGSRPRRYPWGDTGAVCRRAVWSMVDGVCGLRGAGPDVAGSRPDGASPEGFFDLAGNVDEWTSTERDGRAAVRGGSYEDRAAAALRTWHARFDEPELGRPTTGARCAYDAR